jgi:DNA-directed RNA polymerase subunit RPC12/RpoP
MRCARCGGLMVREKFEDHGGLGSNDHEYAGWRCINCGAIVDPVIAAHRRLTSQVAASNPALTTA